MYVNFYNFCYEKLFLSSHNGLTFPHLKILRYGSMFSRLYSIASTISGVVGAQPASKMKPQRVVVEIKTL